MSATASWQEAIASDHRDPPAWVSEWVGLPYAERGRGTDGYDCWGIVRAVYAKVYGIDLPSFAHTYDGHRDRARIAQKIQQAVSGWTEVHAPEPGDAVWMWFRDPKQPNHVALYVGGGQAISAHEGDSGLIDLRREDWGKRVVGFYRPRVGWCADESRPLSVPAEKVRVTAPKNGLGHEKVERLFDPGWTLESYLNAIAPLCEGSGKATVYVGGVPVEPHHWAYVRPKAGVDVSVEYVAEEPITTFLLAVGGYISAAASAIGAGVSAVGGVAAQVIGAVGSALGATAFNIGGYAVTYGGILKGVLTVGAAVASSALGQTSSPDIPKQGKDASPTLRGVGNSLRPFDPIPVVFGRHRIFPAFAAPPYTFVQAGKQWVRAVVALQGRYKITELKIGDVAIEEIEGARWQIREGGITQESYEAELDLSRASGATVTHHWRMAALGTIPDRKGGPSLTVEGANQTLVPGTVPLDTTPTDASDFGALTVARTASAVLPAGDSWTICFIVKPDDPDNNLTLLQLGDPDGNGLRVYTTGSGSLNLYTGDNDQTYHARLKLESGALYHLALRKQGDRFDLFVDGIRAKALRDTPLLAPIGDGLVLGGRWNGSPSVTTPGVYDELVIFDAALSDSEIQGEMDRATEPDARTRGGLLRIFSDTTTEVQINRAFEAIASGETPESSYQTFAIPGNAQSFSVTLNHLGLQRIDNSARTDPYYYHLTLEIRDTAATAPEWQDALAFGDANGFDAPVSVIVPDPDQPDEPDPTPDPDALNVMLVKGKRADPFLRQYGFPLPYAATTWEGRMRRIEVIEENRRKDGSSTASVQADCVLVSVRGLDPSEPFQVDGLSTVAIEAPVDALGGSLNQLNLIAESVVPIYDASGNLTGEAPSRNPADLVLWAWLTHPAGIVTIAPRQMDASDVDFSEFDSLRQWAEDEEFYHDSVLDAFENWFLLGVRLMRCARAQPDYTEDGKWGVIIDRAKSASAVLISARNAQGFTITRTFVDQYHAKRARFLNADKGYREDQRIVYADGYDADTASKFQEIDLTQDGITDPDHVYRHVRVEMAANKLIREVMTCTMGPDQYRVRRGMRVKYAHPVAVVGRAFGRVIQVFYDTVDPSYQAGFLLDAEMTYEDGADFGSDLMLFSGIRFHRDLVNRAAGTGTTVRSNRFDFVDSVPTGIAAIEVGTLVVAGINGLESGDALVLAKVPQPDRTAQVMLVPYQSGVYTAADEAVPPFDSQITLPAPLTISGPALPVIAQVTSDESAMAPNASGVLLPRILIDYTVATGRARIPVARIEAQYRASPGGESGGTEWKDLPSGPASGGRFVVENVEEEVAYDVRLRSIGENAVASLWVYELSHIVIGRSAPPATPTNLRLERNDRLRWTMTLPPPDLAGYRVRVHTGSRVDWESASPLHDELLTDAFFDLPMLGGGERTFLVKAFDTSGNESTLPVTLTTTMGDPETQNAVISVDHRATGFPGTKVGCTVVAGDLVADSVASDFWGRSDSDPFWTDDAADYWGGSYSEMTYQFTVAQAAADPAGELFLNLTAQGAVEIEYDRGLTGTFLPFPGRISIASGESIAVLITGAAGGVQALITRLISVVDVPDVIEQITSFVVASTGTVRLPITQTYRAITGVLATIYDPGDGIPRTFELVDKGTGGPPLTLGPSVLIKQSNALSTRLSATIDARVIGY